MTNKVCVYCGQGEDLARWVGHRPHCPVTNAAMGTKIRPFVSAELLGKKSEPINLPEYRDK